MNPYKVLRISEDSKEKEIKKSYRILVKKYHPDINPNAKKEILLNIIEAYELLKNNDWEFNNSKSKKVDLESLYKDFLRKNPGCAYYFDLEVIKSLAVWDNMRNRP